MKCNNMICLFNVEVNTPTKYLYEGVCTAVDHNTTPTKAPVNQCIKFLMEGIPENHPKHTVRTLARRYLTLAEYAEYLRDTVVYNNM